MKNSILKVFLIISYMWVFTVWTIYYFSRNPQNYNGTISWEVTNSWTIQTWSWEPSTILDNWEHKLEIYSGSLMTNSLDLGNYPLLKINSTITGWTILFEIEPTDNVKDYWYFQSDSYFFAFRFFIGAFENGWYYDVFRKSNGWVWNDQTLWLDWAISGKNLSDGFEWAIPLQKNVRIAKDKDSYWYGYIDTLQMINGNVTKKVAIWWFLSSIREFPDWWWKITKIKSINIIYYGKKDALTIWR